MKRANATSFAAFVHFDISSMIGAVLRPFALCIANELDPSITQQAFPVLIPGLGEAGFRIILISFRRPSSFGFAVEAE